MVNQLKTELKEAEKKLLRLPSSSPELLNVLAQVERILSGVPQLPSKSIQYAMHPFIEALIAKELVRHPDMDVNISVACCISQILRIMAPVVPYNDEQMKDFFELAVMTFKKLSSASGGCYTKMTAVLKTFSSVRPSVLMLDLQLDELVVQLFQQFLTVADSNSSAVVLEMEKIMTMIIEESEQLTLELVGLLVTSVRKDNQIASPVRWQLGENVLKNCAGQLKTHLPDIEAKELAVVYNSLGETNPSTTDTSKLIKDTTHKRKLERTEGIRNMVQTVRHCRQAAMHTVSLPGIHSEGDYGDVSSAGNQGPNSVTSRNKRRIKPNPLIHKSEGYDHTGKVFLTRAWKKHEKKILSLSGDPLTPSKSETEVKGKRKRNYIPLKKEAPEMSQSLEQGENLVGSRIKVWWPRDETYYEGVVASFDHSTKKHKVCYTDGDEEILNVKEERWELVENVFALPDSLVQALPRKVSSPQSGIVHVQGYKVKHSVAPILEAIFMEHGDIAAECVFKTASVRASFLEVVCEVVRRIQTNDVTTIISEMEEIESEVSEAEAANIDVSWLRAHLEAFHKRKEARKKSSLLMETIANTRLVKRAAKMDLIESYAELVAAQQQFESAERCVKVLDLVEKKLNNIILESKAEEDSWAKPPIV